MMRAQNILRSKKWKRGYAFARIAGGSLILALLARFSEPAIPQTADLATQAQALLKDRCYECHSPGGTHPSASAALAAFDMTQAAQMTDKAGTISSSRILTRVTMPSNFMPPPNATKSGPLSGAEIDLLTQWVTAGAPLVASTGTSTLVCPAPIDPGSRAYAVLSARCGECHSPGGTNPNRGEALGELNIDSATSLKRRAGTTSRSPILEAVSGRGEDAMPPASATDPSPLTADQLAALSDWVAAGAPAPTPPPVCGDLNGDGKVTTADATLALQVVVQKLQSSDLRHFSDMNGDGQVTVADAILILRLALGLKS